MRVGEGVASLFSYSGHMEHAILILFDQCVESKDDECKGDVMNNNITASVMSPPIWGEIGGSGVPQNW